MNDRIFTYNYIIFDKTEKNFSIPHRNIENAVN